MGRERSKSSGIAEILEVAWREAEDYYVRNGIEVTLRGLFYILVSKNVMPNTLSAYKRLSRKLAEARYRGKFPAYLIRDVTRASVSLEPFELEPRVPSEEELRRGIELLADRFAMASINAWNDQPKKVIVLIEKEAQFELVKKFITDSFKFGVYEVTFTRGYDSATDMIRLARTVRRLNENGKKVAILIITDFDPSGDDIARDYVERLKYIDSGLDIEAEKVAVTREQVEMYNLPCIPESAEELEKLRRDTRFKGFVSRYGLVRVELDALIALRPDEFKQILINSVRKHFNYEIYEEITKPKEIELKSKSEEVKRRISEMLARLVQS